MVMRKVYFYIYILSYSRFPMTGKFRQRLQTYSLARLNIVKKLASAIHAYEPVGKETSK